MAGASATRIEVNIETNVESERVKQVAVTLTRA